MGSTLRVLSAGAEHRIAQSQIDAARIKQGAHNAAQLSLVESKKIVQNANNAASVKIATARQKMQDGYNSLVLANTEGQRKVQAAANATAEQVAEAKRVVQAARNERAGVNSDIAKWSQSLANQNKLDQIGDEVNRITTDVLRFSGGAASGNLFDRINNAEQLGAAVAQAAAAGSGGSAIATYNQTMNLRQDLKEEAEHRALTGKVSDAYQARADTLRQAQGINVGVEAADLDYNVYSAEKDYSAITADLDYSAIYADQDFTVFNADLDYTQYVDHKKMGLGAQLLTFAAAGAATYFGGPSAGMAVMDTSMALQDLRNGNMAGAQQGFGNALKNGTSGFTTYRAGATSSTSGKAWGSSAVSKVGAALKL